MEKKYKILIGIAVVIIAVLLLLNYHSKNAVGITYFDINGNPINNGMFSIVGKPNATYVGFNLFVTNNGNTVLNNVTVTESHPNILSQTIISSNINSLDIGQSAAIATTINPCSIDLDCKTNQKCVSGKCLINIQSISGITTFGFTTSAEWYDAFGNKSRISNLNEFNISITNTNNTINNTTCSDGTPEGQCSSTKPKWCFNSGGNQLILVDRADVCGCNPGEAYYPPLNNPPLNKYGCIPNGTFCTSSFGLTLIGQCVLQNTQFGSMPLYCNASQQIISKASICGCAYNQIVKGDICMNTMCPTPGLSTCSDGTQIGHCSTTTGASGAYELCTDSCPVPSLIEACNTCGAKDINGNHYAGCSKTTDPSGAIY